MKNLLSSLFLIIAISLPVHAATVSDNVEAKYAKIKYLQADFTQETYIELLEQNQFRKGRLYFGKNKFRIDYLEPKKQSYIFNGKTLWIYSPEFKEVEVYSDADQRISKEALVFLSGLGTLKSTFKILKTKTNGDQSTLNLIPKNNESHLKEIQLIVDKKDYTLEEAILWPKQGNKSHYVFTNLELDNQVSDKLFNFRAPKNVKVIKQK